MYLINGTCAANIVFFGLMALIAKKRQQYSATDILSIKQEEHNRGYEKDDSESDIATSF